MSAVILIYATGCLKLLIITVQCKPSDDLLHIRQPRLYGRRSYASVKSATDT